MGETVGKNDIWKSVVETNRYNHREVENSERKKEKTWTKTDGCGGDEREHPKSDMSES